MKISMKRIIRAMSIIMVVIVYITTILLSHSLIDTDKFFSVNNIIILAVFVLAAYIIPSIRYSDAATAFNVQLADNNN